MARAAVGDDDENENENENTEHDPVLRLPPEMFSVAAVMADRNAELARQLAAAFRPQMPALEQFQRLSQSITSQVVPVNVGAEFARSVVETVHAPVWEALAAAMRKVQVPSLVELLGTLPPAPTPVEVEQLDAAVEHLHAAGVTPTDLDRFGIVVILLRMMALGGVAGTAVVVGGPAGWLASLTALQTFLGELMKLRDRLEGCSG